MLSSPDPPKYSEEDFRLTEVPSVDLEEHEDGIAEDSGDESTGQQQFLYQLLPQDNSTEINNEIGNAGGEDYFESSEISHPMMNTEEGATAQVSEKERVDIEVNDEEVRAAMQNITLPPSSIPPWAASVPESQWTSFLLSRLSLMDDKSQSSSQ